MPEKVKKSPETEERANGEDGGETQTNGKSGPGASGDADGGEGRRRQSSGRAADADGGARQRGGTAKGKAQDKGRRGQKASGTAEDERNSSEPPHGHRAAREKPAEGEGVKGERDRKRAASAGGDMSSEERKGKDGEKKKKKKKKKKPAEEAGDDEAAQEEEEEEEEEEEKKKRKKEKKKKKGSDSDEEKRGRKGRKSKGKQENYAELYQQELVNYHTDESDGYEEEYYKKKVYEVVTVTGDVKGAGTDANVFVSLYGEYGVTPKVHLASNTEKRSRTAFEKNKTDVFRIKTHNVGPIKKLRIEHDNTGMSASWFLDRVILTDMSRPHLRFFFSCTNWLSREEGDGLTVRYLLGSLNPMDIPKQNKYIASVFTMDVKGSGTDADVFLTIFGERGDTGERKLVSEGKDNFERGNEDKFTIDAPNLGNLRKITIGHNNKGSSAGWGCDKVIIDDMGNKEVYEFPVNAFFDISEGDGKIQRDVLVGGLQPMAIVYNVQVMTGDVRGAGTNSKIHLVMYGRKGVKNSGKVFLEGGTFERAQIDVFSVELLELLSPLSRVTIGHDNAGISCGWYCEKVMVYCPFTGIEQVFPCGQWLDEDEGAGLVERELYEMVSLRQRKQKKFPWSLWIWTSDVKGAGTDAQVFLQVYGETGKSDEMKLESKSDSFEQGQCDKFMIEMPDIGKVRKLRIWHEKRNPFSGWHLGRVTLMKTLNREKYNFVCNRWLDINEDDNEIVRELPATGVHVPEPLPLIKYRVTICTGTVSGSGTDASVYLNVIGDLGDSGERLMFMSKNNVNKFEKGNADEFIIEVVSLGTIRRVRIGHDGRGGGCGWFLDKVVVREEGQPESTSVEFPCYRWLDRNEDDGQIVRELVPTGDGQTLFNVSYHIAVKTGNVNGASSDSKVFVKLYGEKGDTNKIMLVVSDNDLGNYFETDQTDIFTVETSDLGKINRLLIGHTNEGLRAGWFLDSVQIWVPVHGLMYMFPSHRWLCKDEADGKVEIEIYPSETLQIEKLKNYEVTVVTGNVFAGGTNAGVFLQVYGEQGKTEVIQLKSRSNNFERGSTEIFKIEALDVGKVYKIRIGHDGSGVCAGWFLETVALKCLETAMVKVEKKDKKKKKKKKKKEEEEEVSELREVVRTYHFTCSRWLARDEEDGEILVELKAEDYDDLEENTYEVHVFTGSMWGAGTDAGVYINIYGEMGDTGERKIRKSNHLNKFERGQEDVFSVKAMDLGLLKKLRIRHDGKQANSAWYLDRVEIIDTKDETRYFFPCQRWLAVDEDDGQLARELVPVDEAFMNREEEDEDGESVMAPAQLGLEQKAMSTTYTMRIKTGEKKHAGTDANVYAVLNGTKDDTGIVTLKACKNHRNKFELGLIDEFTIEAVDLGSLKRIRIGHDNAGASPGWFLDWVEIDAPSLGQCLRFPCGRWLDKREDDGAIYRDLYPNDLQTELYTPYVPYEIKVFTSDVFAAGTDADVFVALYGQSGACTAQKSLCVNKRERRMYFKRGAADMFIVELEDIGDIIEKLRIGHDNRGVNGGWHLDRVEVRRLLRKGKGSETTIFLCERWLARSEDDGETIRELVPSNIIIEKLSRDGTLKVIETEVDDALETHTYSVSVTTGDVYGAGTDANVFITVYGDMGDTGERKLSKSENNKNKFERRAVDTFSIEAVDLGHVFKIRIRHDNSMLSPDWYLDQVEVVDTDTDEEFLFQCERWLSRKKEDKRIDRVFYVKGFEGERETAFCPIKKVTNLDSNMNKNNKKQGPKEGEEEEEPSLIPYHVSVMTGSERDAGTSSRAYVIIRGVTHTETQLLWLHLQGKKDFRPGALDYFTCYGTDVGEIKKVELGHDGATPESCWLVEEFSVAVPTKGTMYMFPCKCWLAKDRGDGLTVRVFNVLDADTVSISRKVIYEVTVVTGDVQHAGTDTQIYMTVFGMYGTSEEILLPKLEDRFERGQNDTFNLEIEDIAPLRKMRVRTDGTGSRPDWFLDKVVLHNLETDEEATFTCEEWLSHTYGPARTLVCEMPAVIDEEEMVERTTYTISVKTSDAARAGTDANVWMILFGENGDTGPLALKESSNTNKFERKQTDTFRFQDILSLGELSKIRVWHDNTGLATSWHLEYVDVHDDVMGKKFRFQCDRWLSKSRDDRQAMRELACASNDVVDFDEKTKYEILATTADTEDAETKENAWIILEGKKGRSREFVMENSTKKKRFLRGATDRFEFSSKNLGDIPSICLGHTPKDGKKTKAEAFWRALEVVVTEKELGNKYIFHCDSLIPLSSKRDDFQTFACSKFIESFASKARSLVAVKYEVIVITGQEKGAGTDARVFITIFGTNGDSGRRRLRQRCRNLFERGRTDRFLLELLDMGELLRLRVEHDSRGPAPGWLLARVEVTNTANGVTTVFPCGKWLDKNRADGRTERVLYPKF
ncbi:lipoxygenase homology domain-containing protein 1-like [Electrophorus electricus]|uniref:lipoxygenase homology domain-containing protein 1-like n=1 Tax=Electrophorus electricus TaxID=8005 RepID=UPI0015CFC163|nr:lipoxygenase homology domain-containing protein 1-like [Electrophorus electricus]